jgi:DNA repair protein RadC
MRRFTQDSVNRLCELGAHALATQELLSLVIGGRKATAQAQQILAKSEGSLRRLAVQPAAFMTAIAGVSTTRAAAVSAALEIGRRFSAETREENMPMKTPRDVWSAFAPRLEDLPVEEFHVAVLDAQHRLERDITITRGILNSSLVHPREVFREAIAERAACIILVHNHPSGDPTPSADDRAITAQLVAAGRLLDIPVADHVVIGRGRYLSFAEGGLL